jgi:hypothetical protein
VRDLPIQDDEPTIVKQLQYRVRTPLARCWYLYWLYRYQCEFSFSELLSFLSSLLFRVFPMLIFFGQTVAIFVLSYLFRFREGSVVASIKRRIEARKSRK